MEIFRLPAESYRARMRKLTAAPLIGLLLLVVVRFDATGANLPVEVLNRTPLDTGDFSLLIDMDGDTIFLRGKFFPNTTAGERIIGNVLFGVSFQDKDGSVLAESTALVRQHDLGLAYWAPIGRVAPAPGGVDVNALSKVVLTVRELTMQEAGDRERRKQEQAAGVADAKRAQAARVAEAKRAQEREAQRQAAIRAHAWPEHIKTAAIERRVLIGMTAEQATLAWGKPNRVNRTVGRWGVHEQWIYGSTYLYFDNDRLTSFQDSR
jgi:hypothetical protein